MKSKLTFRKPIAWLLTLAMIISMLPVSVFATEDIEMDISETSTEAVCDCGTDDVAIHATTCAVYVAPENPVCYCAEKCTEDNVNIWCDVCGVQGVAACKGADEAAVYDNYDLWIGDQQFTSEKLTISGGEGTATYDPTTNTLTLNNYTYAGPGKSNANGAIWYVSDASLKLVLEGTNSVTQQGTPENNSVMGFYSEKGSVTVSGTGSLTVKGGTAVHQSRGMVAYGGITVSDGASLTAESGTAGYSCGVDATVTVSGSGKLTAIGGTATDATDYDSCGVYGRVTVSDNGSLKATGGTAPNGKSYGVYAKEQGPITVSGGTVEAQGNDGAFDVVPTIAETHAVYDVSGAVIETPVWTGDGALTYAKIAEKPTGYPITISASENGTVEADNTMAKEGETVTLTVIPAENYKIVKVSYNDGTDDFEIIAADGVYSFIMPASDVTVSATFKLITEHTINWSGSADIVNTPEFDLTQYLPKDISIEKFSILDLPNILSGYSPTYSTNMASVKLTTRVFDEPYSETVNFVVESSNYPDITFKIVVSLTGKYIITIKADAQNATYDGNPHAGFENVSGTLSNGNPYEGTYTYSYETYDGTPLDSAPTEAGDYKVTIAVPEDNETYKGSFSVEFSILAEPQASYQSEENGEWKNGTFNEALANVYDGGTVKLLSDIILDSTVALSRNVTITSANADNVCTITTETNAHSYLLNVTADVSLENIIVDGGSKNGLTAKRALIAVNGGKLNIGSGAVVRNNNNTTSNGIGGGICVITGEFVLDGGEICGNTGYFGGGVGLAGGTFTAKSGSITENSAKMGGGVCVWENEANVGAMNVIGNVSIKENTAEYYGGGVNCHYNGSVTLSGNPVISSNTSPDETDGGIYLDGNTADGHASIYVNGLTDGAEISFYTYLKLEGLLIAEPAGDYTISDSDITKMKWNGDDFVLARDNDGNVVLAKPPVIYNVTLNANGGTINSGEITSYVAGKETALPTDVSKKGHEFVGWYENENFTGSAVTRIESTDTGDKEYFAKWEALKYPVTFNAGNGTFADGSKEKTIDVEFGTIPVEPEIPILAGYVFAGWNLALAPVTVEGATYTATYAPSDVSYFVEIYTMDTTGAYGEPETEPKTAKTDSIVSVTPEAKEGFAIDADASILEKIVEADGSTTLKVYYIRNQYDLTIVVDGIEDTKTYYYGETVETPTIPTKTGYTFDGWDKDIPTTMPARDVDLTAQWTANTNTPYVVKHWVQTLDAAKAQNSEANETNYTLYETENLTGTTDASVNKTKEIAGFKFPEGVVKTFTISADGETVHNYYYVRNKYTITINSDAGIETSSGADQYYYDDTVSISATLKSGYKWTEWIASENGYGSENIAYSFNMPATALVLTPKTTSKDEVSINTDVQSGYVYDKNPKAFEIKGTSLTDDSFTISYKQGETPVANPTNAGTYDVIITRPEDDTYKAYSKTITGGLVIKKKLVDSPIIPIKLYNGFLQTADVEDTDLYEVMKNEGGVEVGDYDVVLKLKDSDNYMWSIVGLDETITLDFNIVPVTHNSWTTDPTISGWTYGDEANAPSYAAKIGHVVVEYKKASEEDSAYTTVIPTNAGEYNVRFTVAETSNHGGLSKVIELNIAKATPLYTPPTNLTATYGQTLADVQGLTNGFTFMAEDTTSVGNAGNNTFKLKFTPADTDNYNVVENIDATVIVAQKEIGIEWGNTEFIYNKTEQKPTATATGLVAGDSCAITVTGGQINAGSGYGAIAESLSNVNYKLPAIKTTTFNIAQKSVTITGVTIEATRVYDRETNAAITNYGTVSNVIEGDTVTVNTAGASATYNDKNVGNGKAVTFSGFAITGTDAGNYVLSGQPESQSANITPKPVTITIVAVEATKTYDANTTASIENYGSVDGVISGDTVDVNSEGATAAYADANVGNDKAVTFTGFAITGADASNYELSAQPASTTANITAKDIAGAEITLGESLIYNGNAQPQTIASAIVDGLTITYDVSGNVNTDAGDYTLTITGNGNFEGTAQKAYTIAKADATLGTAPSAITPLTYNAAEQTLVSAGENVVGGTLMYKLGEGEYSAELPKATNAGTYTVYYKFVGDNNHNDVAEQSFAVTITEKVVSPVVVLTAPAPNQTPQTSIETDEYTAVITWSPAVTDKFAYSTDYTATVTITPKANYTLTGITENEYTIEGATVTNSANSGTITAVFPKTSSRPSGGGGGVTRYTVKFDTDGGSTVSNTTVTRNAKVTEPKAPEKEGYTFMGWFADEALTEAYDFDTKVTKNITLYAKWEKHDDESDEPDNTGSHNCPSKEFDDLDVNAWYHLDTDYVIENGLMKGTATDKFAPNDNLTRAMLVTVLYRVEGEPEMKDAQWFEDVEKGQWYSDAVAWATFNGITMGYGNGNFGPNDYITREQIAAIMHRYAQYKGYDVSVGENTNILSYDDFHSISEYAIAAMQYACGSGLMKGKTASTLNPLDNATRAEIAAILHRFIEANK